MFTVNHRDRVVACWTRCCRRWNSPVGQYRRRFGPRRGWLPPKNGRVYCETARPEDGSWFAVGRTPANTPRVSYYYYISKSHKRIYPHHQKAIAKEPPHFMFEQWKAYTNLMVPIGTYNSQQLTITTIVWWKGLGGPKQI